MDIRGIEDQFICCIITAQSLLENILFDNIESTSRGEGNAAIYTRKNAEVNVAVAQILGFGIHAGIRCSKASTSFVRKPLSSLPKTATGRFE